MVNQACSQLQDCQRDEPVDVTAEEYQQAVMNKVRV